MQETAASEHVGVAVQVGEEIAAHETVGVSKGLAEEIVTYAEVDGDEAELDAEELDTVASHWEAQEEQTLYDEFLDSVGHDETAGGMTSWLSLQGVVFRGAIVQGEEVGDALLQEVSHPMLRWSTVV